MKMRTEFLFFAASTAHLNGLKNVYLYNLMDYGRKATELYSFR